MNKGIEDFSWYQTIEFEPGVKSKGCLWCGDPAWENIKKFLPKSLEGQRVLDLGCNAGIFCVRAALMGAKECVGIESDTWKIDANYLEQAFFVRKYFERKHSLTLPIFFIESDMNKILEQDMGHFDWCFAIASLYYAKDPEKLVKRLAGICDNVIARIRDENQIEKFSKIFEKNGFKLKESLQEKWWEKLNQPTDDFWLFHYVR